MNWKDILKDDCGCGCDSCEEEEEEDFLKASKKPKIKRVKGGVMYRGEKFPGLN